MNASRPSPVPVLTLAFGVSVAMWTLGYLGRLPGSPLPGWLLGGLMLLCLPAGGWLVVRAAGRDPSCGIGVGLFASLINLLILGSLLADGRGWLWLPGSLLLGVLLSVGGAWLARAGGRGEARSVAWNSILAWIAAAAAFLLLTAGGLVTSHEAGLAVPDWPGSYGHNMFLYPLSRMSGGIYYEHAHRLLGTLVGLATLVLALQLWRTRAGRVPVRLGFVALAVVIVQGILGGLRVTGRFTLSQEAAELQPNLTLAMAHGVLGQLFLAALVLLAVITGRRWAGTRPRPAGGDARLAEAFVGLLVVQLALGVLVRHAAWGLWAHIGFAVLVLLAGFMAAARAWEAGSGPARGLGKGLVVLLVLQIVLGSLAAVLIWTREAGPPGGWEVLLATAHQATGALILASAAALVAWQRRDIPLTES